MLGFGQLLDSLIQLFGAKHDDMLSPEGVNVTADSCLAGLVAMTLIQNRDQGSIPH